MRVFVTGATGFIGTAVVRELIGAGHQVVGLARSDKSADALKITGAEVHRGNLDDLSSLRDGADAARLFRLALEDAPAGSILHGAGEEGVPVRDIADVIGRHLNLPVVSLSKEEADAHFGFFGSFASIDNPTSSALTQERFGWQPVNPKLIPDLEEGHYFND